MAIHDLPGRKSEIQVKIELVQILEGEK